MGETDQVIRYSLGDDSGQVFSILEKKLQELQIPKTSLPFDFIGGYVGYFGYEIKKLCGYPNQYLSDYPDSLWLFIDKCVVFDHKKRTVYLTCLAKSKQAADMWMADIKSAMHAKSLPRKRYKQPKITAKMRFAFDKVSYIEAINKCKTHIKNGESYEICLTNHLNGITNGDPLELYSILRKVNQAPYAAYLRDGDFAILCSSPERFLKIDQNRWVESKPMKGTMRRSTDKRKDRKLAAQLQTSEKDRAENLMIVDLIRNDLGRVCKIGSVQVSQLMAVESYQTVHQMTSTIRGELKTKFTGIDCIKACFPGGSMTGAPKKRTIDILEKLEKNARGVYSGSLGFLSANGAVDLNIIIRTIVMQRDKFSIGSGGAITYQSDPKKEYDEMLLKVQALRSALTQTP